MDELSMRTARQIIERVGASGIPPEYGFQFFTAGLDPYLAVLDEEYLATYVSDGGSAFKLVVGVYGGGKTHFLYSVRDLAWKHNFIVSYVSLSPGESPFHKLELVYRAVVNGLIPARSPDELLSGYEKGLQSFLKGWYSQTVRDYQGKGITRESQRQVLLDYLEQIAGIESISFAKAIKAAFISLMDRQDEDFDAIMQWLRSEGYERRTHARFGILQRIDKTTAFIMLRSLAQWIRQIGYSGLVILLDEAERVPSLSTREREQHLNNLRELIDETARISFQGVMLFYAVPDDNFLEGRTQIYEALNQRLATVFETLNPSGVRIELEQVVAEPLLFLSEVGQKLARVYSIAYKHEFEPEALTQTIDVISRRAYAERYGDIGYKRRFVQLLVNALHRLRQTGTPPSPID